MLQKGDTFLSKEEKKRMALQLKWRKMFYSEEVYLRTITGVDDKGSQITKRVDPLIPIPQTVSEIFSDLLFLKFPEISFQDDSKDEVVKEYTKRLGLKILEASSMNTATGMIFISVFIRNGKIGFVFRTPEIATWEKGIEDELTNIKFIKPVKEDSSAHKKFMIEEYSFVNDDPNQGVLFEVYTVRIEEAKGKVVEVVPNKEPETMEIDVIPVAEVINLGQMGSPIGKSDYQGKEQMFAEIDNIVDQISYVLYENTEPWRFLPHGVLDENGHFNRKRGKMIEKGPGGQADNAVDIVTWDASLGSAFEQIKTLLRMILFTSRISSPISGFEMDGGGVESGKALKWRSVSTFSSVARRQLYWNAGFRSLFSILSALDSRLKDINIDDMTVGWKENIPMDDDAIVDMVVKRVQNDLMSKLTGIEKLDKVEEKTAQEELDQIRKEQGDEADLQTRSLNQVTL